MTAHYISILGGVPQEHVNSFENSELASH